MSLADIERKALSLSERDRLQLIEALWNSLESGDSHQRSRKWSEEAERRLDAVDFGQLPTLDASQVFRELRGSTS